MGAVAYCGYGASAISQANKPAFSVKPAPGVTRRPLITAIGLGSACQGTP
jgi:hypothetical protein